MINWTPTTTALLVVVAGWICCILLGSSSPSPLLPLVEARSPSRVGVGNSGTAAGRSGGVARHHHHGGADDAICPDVRFANRTYGHVFSPDYPSNYPNNADCWWRIEVPTGNIVSLVLYAMRIEACCDHLYIYNGDYYAGDSTRANGKAELIAKLSGDQLPLGNIYATSATNVMTLNFVSDLANNEKGFYGRFDAIPNSLNDPTFAKCPPANYIDPFGAIVSPLWPNFYPNDAACHFHIDLAEKKRRVQLLFNYFDTEACCDKLSVYDGPNERSPLLKVISGRSNVSGTTLTSSGPSMTLVFVSDMQNQAAGFSITYESIV